MGWTTYPDHLLDSSIVFAVLLVSCLLYLRGSFWAVDPGGAQLWETRTLRLLLGRESQGDKPTALLRPRGAERAAAPVSREEN